MRSDSRHSASFRDPSGFIFWRDGSLYRQVNRSYQPDYDQLMNSGLYQKLVQANLLIPHQETEIEPEQPSLAYKIIRPEPVGFISYPYEWSFSQLKDAALATLLIQKEALAAGMCLKDASAYNIQFQRGCPVLVDTLSFETYREGAPWIAYRQFCQHFLAPLALMAYCDIRFSQMLRSNIDGIPLDFASKLLPRKTRFGLGLAMHIHWHAAAQKRFAGTAVKPENKTASRMSRVSFQGLIDSLETTVRKLHWQPEGTAWGDYYTDNLQHYTDETFEHKKQVIR